MHSIKFFTTARGECLVIEFLKRLEKGFQAKVDAKIRYLRLYGEQARRPIASPLKNKIYELRVSYKNLCLRILYFFDKDIIMMTHAFFKKSDAVPPAEIDKAVSMRDEYFGTK